MLDGITTAICRPPRAQYSLSDLGPPRVRYRGVEYKRKDFSVKNSRGMAVMGSVWELINPSLGDSESCILYLHPNSGSRVDVVKTRIMSVAATAKCTVCGFDFSGCGSSDGENVSLGVREKEDICAVMSYLLARGCRRFILWGRSMGAASAAMFFGAYKEIIKGCVVALVLDSPFTSMHGLATEYTSSTKIPVPSILLSPALHVLRQNILSRHDFDILHISPLAAASRITVPTVVLSGSEDKIVPPALSEAIYGALSGPKLRIFFKGGHNTHRPTVVFDAIRVVLTGALRGLHAEEYLHLSAAVIANNSNVSSSSKNQLLKNPSQRTFIGDQDSPSGPSGGDSKNGMIQAGVTMNSSKDRLSSAEEIALEQEQAVSNMLRTKNVESLSENDISLAIGDRKNFNTLDDMEIKGSPNSNSCRKATGGTGSHAQKNNNRANESVSLSKKNSSNSQIDKAVCMVQLDVCEEVKEYGGMLEDTWSDSIGRIFWGKSEQETSQYPRGSLGYLTRHLSREVCPPVGVAWEELLLSFAVSSALNAVIDQIIFIVSSLEESRLAYSDTHADMNEKDEALMMSMVVAQITAEMGIFSVEGQETTSWGKLFMLTSLELQEIVRRSKTTCVLGCSHNGDESGVSTSFKKPTN